MATDASSREGEPFEPLLEVANPSLFRANVFRVTGQAVTAARKDILKRGNRLLRELGQGSASPTDGVPAFTLDPRPDAEAIQQALSRLENPQQRLVDEFFWFWPLSFTRTGPDEALAALAKGETKLAADLWRAVGSSDLRAPAARHNLAIMEHVLALDSEHMALEQVLANTDVDDLERRWQRLIESWVALVENENLWRDFTAHVEALADAQLTSSTVERLRASLPLGLALVNANLALRFVGQVEAKKRAARDPAQATGADRLGEEQEQASRHALRQRRLLGRWQHMLGGAHGSAVEEARRRAAFTPERRIAALCESSKASAEAEPLEAEQVARRLLDQSQDLLAQLDILDDHGSQHGEHAHDEVGLAVLRCQVLYGNKTEDWETSAELLRLALGVAASESTRSTLRKEIEKVEEIGKSGPRWCKPGYFHLPAPLLAVLERARADFDGGEVDRALATLIEVFRGEGPAGLLLAAHRSLVAHTLGIVLLRRSVTTWNRRLAEVDAEPDALIEQVRSRVLADRVPPSTLHAAQLDEPGYADVPLVCMACGESIYGRFVQIRINDKVKAVVCVSCRDRAVENRNAKLRAALRIAGEAIVLAQHFAPDEEAIKRNLATLREQMSDVGGVQLPPLEQCLMDRGLVTAEYLVDRLGSSASGDSAYKKLTEMGAKALPALLAALDKQAALVMPLIERLGQPAVDALLAFLAQAPSEAHALAAIRLLAKFREARTVLPLLRLLEASQAQTPVRVEICRAIAQALEGFGAEAAVALPALLRGADQGDVASRIAFISAAVAVGGSGSPELLERLLAWLAPDHPDALRVAVARALERMGSAAATALPALLAGLGQGEVETRVVMLETALAVGKDHASELVEYLGACLAEGVPEPLRLAAAGGIVALGPVAARLLPALLAAAGRGAVPTRVALIKALLAAGRGQVHELVEKLTVWLTTDEASEVREEAARALGELGEAAAAATDDLLGAMKDRTPAVRRAAREALVLVAPAVARKLRLRSTLKRLAVAAAAGVVLLLGLGGAYSYSAATSQGDLGSIRLLNGVGVLGGEQSVHILLSRTLPAANLGKRKEILACLNAVDRNWRQLPSTNQAIGATVARLGAVSGGDYTSLRDDLELFDPEWNKRPEAKAAVAQLVTEWSARSNPVPWQTLAPWAAIVVDLGLAAEPLVPLLAACSLRREGSGADESAAGKAQAALRILGKLGSGAAAQAAAETESALAASANTKASLALVEAAAKLCESPKTKEAGVAKLTAFIEVGNEAQAMQALTVLRGLGAGAAPAAPAIRRATQSNNQAIAQLARQALDEITAAPKGKVPVPAADVSELGGVAEQDILKKWNLRDEVPVDPDRSGKGRPATKVEVERPKTNGRPGGGAATKVAGADASKPSRRSPPRPRKPEAVY